MGRQRCSRRRSAPARAGLSFRGVSAFAPASHVSDFVELARSFDTPSPLTGGFSGLGALILEGAAIAEPSLWQKYRDDGGLSAEALELMPDTQRLCLADLSQRNRFVRLPMPPVRSRDRTPQVLPVYAVLDAMTPYPEPARGSGPARPGIRAWSSGDPQTAEVAGRS